MFIPTIYSWSYQSWYVAWDFFFQKYKLLLFSYFFSTSRIGLIQWPSLGLKPRGVFNHTTYTSSSYHQCLCEQPHPHTRTPPPPPHTYTYILPCKKWSFKLNNTYLNQPYFIITETWYKKQNCITTDSVTTSKHKQPSLVHGLTSTITQPKYFPWTW